MEQCFFFIFLRDKTDYMTTQTQKNNIEHFKNILKSHSLKATPQRLAVHEAMLKLGHASADMVTEEIQKSSGTKVTVASVYNILTSMAMLGIYHHRLSSNNKMYFDVNTFRHFHIYDCENHQYRDVVDNDLMEIIEKHFSRRRFRGYSIENIDIQLIGRPTRKRKAQ